MATTGFSAAAALTCLGWSLTALGQETPSTTTQLASATPYTVAEFGVGILALPTTDICLAQPNTCTKGDLTPHGWIWMLYRASSEFVVGAGTSLARPFSGETTKRTEQITEKPAMPPGEGWEGYLRARLLKRGALLSDPKLAFGELLGPIDIFGGMLVGAALVLIRLPSRRTAPI